MVILMKKWFLEKFNYIIIGLASICLIAMFFFPEPQTNFLAYAGMVFVFTVVIVILFMVKKNETGK